MSAATICLVQPGRSKIYRNSLEEPGSFGSHLFPYFPILRKASIIDFPPNTFHRVSRNDDPETCRSAAHAFHSEITVHRDYGFRPLAWAIDFEVEHRFLVGPRFPRTLTFRSCNLFALDFGGDREFGEQRCQGGRSMMSVERVCDLMSPALRLWSCPLHGQDSDDRCFDTFFPRLAARFFCLAVLVMHARNVLLRKEENMRFLFVRDAMLAWPAYSENALFRAIHSSQSFL